MHTSAHRKRAGGKHKREREKENQKTVATKIEAELQGLDEKKPRQAWIVKL